MELLKSLLLNRNVSSFKSFGSMLIKILNDLPMGGILNLCFCKHLPLFLNQISPLLHQWFEELLNLQAKMGLPSLHHFIEAIVTEENAVPVELALFLSTVVPHFVPSLANAEVLLLLNEVVD